MLTRLTIHMDNSAFEDCNGFEVARILRGIADEFENENLLDGDGFGLKDINGNTVGIVEVKEG